MNLKISSKKIKTDQETAQKLLDIIYHGARIAADEIYPFYRSVYDEDAGVFTDYGQNSPNRTFAQTNMLGMLEIASIAAQQWVFLSDPDIVEIELPQMAVGTICQLIWNLYCNDKLQRRVWINKITEDWESDGHYGTQKKEEYIETEMKRLWIDSKTGRKIIESIMGY